MQKLACDTCGNFERLDQTKHTIKHVILRVVEDPRPQMAGDNPVFEADICNECLDGMISKNFREAATGELPGFLSEPTERERDLRLAQ